MMLEKITSTCYVSYHIRKKNKNQLKIQKTFSSDVRKSNVDYFKGIKSAYAICPDNWYNILTIRSLGDACEKNMD